MSRGYTARRNTVSWKSYNSQSREVYRLSTESDVSREMIGKYERGEAVPSIEAAKK